MKNNKSRREDLTGKTFGRLAVTEYIGLDSSGKRALWKCECECGSSLIVRKDSLKKGATKSCGCLNKEIKNSWGVKNQTHGLSKHRINSIWNHMRRRCENPKESNYENYGGRGIKVCKRWKTFENFIEDMYESYIEHADKFGEKNTSIDRLDSNGDYEPGNCRWATPKAQANNTRRLKPFVATNIKTGEKHYASNQADFAKKVGINVSGISRVLNEHQKSYLGWTFKFLKDEVQS